MHPGTYTKKNIGGKGGGWFKKKLELSFLSMNDDINKLHNY